MPQEQNPGIKLRHLKIENFKALDSLELDFPAPRFPDEPDVVVLGSKNGLGKTSVLEACSLLFCSALYGKNFNNFVNRLNLREFPLQISDFFIRAGKDSTNLRGQIQSGNELKDISLALRKNGSIENDANASLSEWVDKSVLMKSRGKRGLSPAIFEYLLISLAGLSTEPLILPCYLYLHSYRKIQEGNPDLSSIANDLHYHKRYRYHTPISSFKMEILRLMMGRVGLFEGLNEDDSGESINQLNQLLERYTDGFIEKLRPSVDNTVEFRVTLKGGGPSFSFDGLSSGQKEIISTLFLIWRYTKDNPGIVLIDEPELHLNAEWQRDFVQQLYKIAPRNQYILATHSEDIVDSVPPDRRFLLVPQEAGRC